MNKSAAQRGRPKGSVSKATLKAGSRARALKDRGLPVPKIAKVLGVSRQYAYVLLAGHPALRPCHRRPWTPREDRLLGTLSDRRLAKKLGRTVKSVEQRRSRLGIAPHRQSQGQLPKSP